MSLDKGLVIVRQHDLTIFAGIPPMPVAFLELHFDKGLNIFLRNLFEIEMNGSLNV